MKGIVPYPARHGDDDEDEQDDGDSAQRLGVISPDQMMLQTAEPKWIPRPPPGSEAILAPANDYDDDGQLEEDDPILHQPQDEDDAGQS